MAPSMPPVMHSVRAATQSGCRGSKPLPLRRAATSTSTGSEIRATKNIVRKGEYRPPRILMTTSWVA